MPAALVATADRSFRALRAAAGRRVERSEWVRYRIDLAATPDPGPVTLVPVTDEHIASLRAHADREQNQLVSGFRFWDLGLRRALLWLDAGEPVCIQWLLTPEDNPALRALPEWAGLYLPLSPGTGQVENLFTFSSARRRGAATMFEYALYRVAAAAGLRRLVTHIAASNDAANAWARKTGWVVSGSISRWTVDARGIRRLPVCLHREAPG